MHRLARRFELLLFPYETKRRAFVRKLLGKNNIVRPIFWDHSFELAKSFDSFCEARAGQNCVVLISATKYLQDEGQTPVNYARELAAKGKNVIYIYWRWENEPISTQDFIYDNIFLLPLDQKQFFAKIFKNFDPTQSILINGLPSQQTNELQASAKGARWKTVYLALDDWGAFKEVGAAPWYSVDYEKFVINNSGTIISINDFLAERLKDLGARSVTIVPNGLKLGIEQVREKIKLERGQVTLGYFGYLDKGWFDWELVTQLGKRNPKWLIYIIGYPAALPVDLPANVKFLGKIPQNLLASYAKNWDVGVVPFMVGAVGDGADPIKTYEYLAMGLPVVVSGVNPPTGGETLVARADTVSKFEDAIREALVNNDGYAKSMRRKFAFSCSWEQRTSAILRTIASDRDPIFIDNQPVASTKTKIMFAYPYATFGGVETVLKARIELLDRLGIEAHVWFLLDTGGTSMFHQHPDRWHVGGLNEFKSQLVHGHFEFVSVIDHLPLIEAAMEVKARIKGLAVEFHTPYPENSRYLKNLKPGMVDKIFVPSEYQKKVCLSILNTDIDVFVVPNPVDQRFFSPEMAQQFSSAPRAPMITWVGRLDDLKNWQGFINLAEQIYQQRENIEYCIVGAGLPEDEEEFARIMTASPIAGRLHRYRGLDHHHLVELFDYTKRSGGFVCSTSVAESFGMVIAEAMARGCAVLVPTESAMTDFVLDNETGFHYHQGNISHAAERSLQIIDSFSRRTEVGEAAAELIKQRFHPDLVVGDFLAAADLTPIDETDKSSLIDWHYQRTDGAFRSTDVSAPAQIDTH